MADQEIRKMKEKMEKAVEYLKKELLGVRTGRAHPALVSDIKVDYYGNPTPLSQVGSISTPDARQILITLWDKNAVKAAEKAI
jgi:ribosome recycling factor